MKTLISQDGILTVSPESEIEAYALTKWAEDNFTLELQRAFPKVINFIVSIGPEFQAKKLWADA